MQTAKTGKTEDWRKRKRAGQHRGIIEDAQKLGVHRSTLFRWLRQGTSNPDRLARYHDLLKLRSKPTNPGKT